MFFDQKNGVPKEYIDDKNDEFPFTTPEEEVRIEKLEAEGLAPYGFYPSAETMVRLNELFSHSDEERCRMDMEVLRKVRGERKKKSFGGGLQ